MPQLKYDIGNTNGCISIPSEGWKNYTNDIEELEDSNQID
jgi:hypothetical protein